MSQFWSYVGALVPFLGAALIFYVIIKGVIEGDRRERLAQRKWEAEHPIPDENSQGPSKRDQNNG